MPIDTPHPLYTANLVRWQRCRDAYGGEDAVKAAGVRYLPKINPRQSGAGYDAYRMRASYYEAVGRTVDGFVGAIARKPHTIGLPAGLEPLRLDATGDGVGLDELIKRLCAECLLPGRGALVVDYDDAAGLPYLAFYAAEAVLSWGAAGVVLEEAVYEPTPEDPFVLRQARQLRQLRIDDGRYTVTLWRRTGTAGTWEAVETITPSRRGVALTEMPLAWLSPAGNTARIVKPPLLGLVNVSMSHYRTSADLEHGRHFCGLPTLYVAGRDDTETPLEIGAASAIILRDPAARVGYAEFTGQGLGSLERALDTKERQMAALGAAILGPPRKGVEAAETARIRTAGENSLLMGVVSAVEETLCAALGFAAAWVDAEPPKVALNRDFVDQAIDGPTLTALVGAYQSGALTIEQFLFNLQQGEMLSPDTDLAEEAAKVVAGAGRKEKLAQGAPAETPEG